MDTAQEALEESQVATALVSRIRSGERAAESELIERYQPRLLHVLRRQMPQHLDDVEDVVQSTLATAIVRLREEGIAQPERLGGFIYGIARNLRRENQREQARHRGDTDPEILDRLPDGQPDPERLTAGAETTQLVRRLLADLGERSGTSRDREVLVRLYVLEQEKDEVCRALGIAPDHLRKVVHRARRRLGELLLDAEQHGTDRPDIARRDPQSGGRQHE